MFEVFTTQARRVVVMAQEEARALIHNYVGTEHVLVGLTRQDDGGAVQALTALGISVAALRQEVVKIVAHPHAPDRAPRLLGGGRRRPSGHIPFTPETKKVLELAQREAARLGHQHVGTGHILLGLVRERDGIAAQVLAQFGADLERVSLQVTRMPDDPESERRLPGPATEDTRIVLLTGSERLIVDHPGQPADYVHTDGTVWTWKERWHLIGGVRDGDRIVGRIHLRAYDLVHPDR